MLISKNWLKKHTKFGYSDSELADILNSTGSEVEEIKKVSFDKIFVATVMKIEKHKNADKLKVVDAATGGKSYKIVCGADNYKIGDRVALAKVGAKVGDFEIKKTKIRGVDSEGMLCSEKELGLGNDHAGILILSPEEKEGDGLNKVYEKDTIFDLDITPNRGDCLSHLGMAREISAISTEKVMREPISLEKSSKKASDVIKVDVKRDEDCPRYFARVVEGVSIAPSPKWLKNALSKMGLKSINNVVDITNYILYDLGHPLHAFDMDKINKNRIVVRRASGNESIISLDGEKRSLTREELVIADDKKPIAIAGIIGGENSQVSDDTTNIVIEGAEFDRKVIRKSIKNLNLNTEASYRFERGVDSKGIEHAINKAAKLISEVAGGVILSGVVGPHGEHSENWLEIEPDNIRKYLDLEINDEQIKSILSRLGFSISENRCMPPSFRHDIEVWQDLSEEVGRIHGYDNITPKPIKKSSDKALSNYNLFENIKDTLVDAGLVEVYNYSFLSKGDTEVFKIKSSSLLEVENPLQPENKYLRNNLSSGLLKTISKNASFDPIEIFEIGQVFSKSKESTSLAMALTNKSEISSEEVISLLSDKYSFGSREFKITELFSEELKPYKIKKKSVTVIETDISKAIAKRRFDKKLLSYKVEKKGKIYRKISKYPSVSRDIAVIVKKNIKPEEIEQTIYSISDQIKRVDCFDEFASDKFGKGMKNIAFHLFFQADDKTLLDEEGDKIFSSIVNKLENKYKAKLRT